MSLPARCASALSTAALVLAASCQDDSDDPPIGAAGSDDAGVAAGVNCPVAPRVGPIPELMNASAGRETQHPGEQAPEPPVDPQTYFIFGDIGNMELIELDLWDGYGAFSEGDKRVVAGTYRIEGDESLALLCGVCFYMLGDFDEAAGTADTVYIATGGEVTIDSVSDTLTGSARHLTFTALDYDHEFGGPLVDGCTTTVDSIRFTAPLAGPSSN
jgi:hypothetical protein